MVHLWSDINHDLQLFKDQSFLNKPGTESWRCNIFERECCIVLCSDSLSFWHSTASHCPELIVWRPAAPPCLFRNDAAPRSAFSMLDAVLFEILSRWQADTAGSAVSSSWGPGFFSSLSLDQPSSLTAFSFHVCNPSRCWLHMICSTAVRGIFAWFFAFHAHIFTGVNSSVRTSMLTYDILPNRCLHLWFHPISIASVWPNTECTHLVVYDWV